MRRIFIFIALLYSFSFVQAQEWLTDFEQAKKVAAEKHCEILMLFQGSDWCSVCMRLDKEILSTEVFKDKAAQQYVMLKVDFPRRKANALPKEQQEKNNQLFEKYNQRGYFPLVVLLDQEGQVLGETGYKKMSPEEYLVHLASLKP